MSKTAKPGSIAELTIIIAQKFSKKLSDSVVARLTSKYSGKERKGKIETAIMVVIAMDEDKRPKTDDIMNELL